VLHAGGDSTGRELQRSLYNKVASLQNVSRYPFRAAADLIISDGQCIGATALGRDNLVIYYARPLCLNRRGGPGLFEATNPEVATGDGIAMAYRAGAALQDMEFVQFHPTALFLPGAPHFLLSEAMERKGRF
jgi:L-aspartate oxidase